MWSQNRKSVARFLAVACHNNYLTFEDAADVAEFQDRVRQGGASPCPTVGEIARSLGLLDQATSDKIEAHRKQLDSTGSGVEDPVPFLPPIRQKRVRLGTLLGLSAIAAMGISYAQGATASDAVKIFGLLSIVGTLLKF